MNPALESITSLDDLMVDQGPEQERFTLAEEKAEEEPEKPRHELSYEAQKRIEAQQAEALKIFREVPQEIELKYGNMVLERAFPELQMDARVIGTLKLGEKVKSTVTGEHLSAAELRDHWLLPRGEQISKSTGATYFPKKSTENYDFRNSFLFWELDNVKKLVDSKDPVVPKVAIDTERGDLSMFQRLYGEDEEEVSRDEIKEGTVSLTASEPYTEDIAEADEQDALYAAINEPYIPRHPETQQDVFKITRSQTDSKMPIPIEGEGKSIAEKTWSQISPFIPSKNAASQSPEVMFEIYRPVIISQDLVIIRPQYENGPLECMAYAKRKDKVKGDHWVGLIVLNTGGKGKKESFQAFKISEETVEEYESGAKKPKVDYEEEEVSLIMSKWLNSQERRDSDGEFAYGYPTAALVPAVEE